MSELAEILHQAMAKRVCVSAIYNKKGAILAPHFLFSRHDELYLRAVTVEQDGRKPREPKLGTFKLSGLTEVALTRKLFRPRPFPQDELPQEVLAKVA
jgi:hypothetical protein